ncbi:MAG: hypothetical protein WDW38_004168 [Sanguina aurantia]
MQPPQQQQRPQQQQAQQQQAQQRQRPQQQQPPEQRQPPQQRQQQQRPQQQQRRLVAAAAGRGCRCDSSCTDAPPPECEWPASDLAGQWGLPETWLTDRWATLCKDKMSATVHKLLPPQLLPTMP